MISSRRAIAALVLVPLGVFGLSGCSGGGSAADAVTRADSAGVEIVTSPAVDRPLDWTFERLLVLGGDEDGPGSFSSVDVANTGADAAGDLYVMDGQAHRVVVFGPDGTHLRTMGREGGGPGELQFPIMMAVTPDGIAEVFDIGKRALVRFGSDGEPLEQVPFPYATEPGVRRFYQMLGDRHVIARGFGGGGGESTGRDLDLIGVRLGRPGESPPSDTLRFTEMKLASPEIVMFDCVGLALQPFFTPVMQWAARDDRVAVVHGGTYAIDVYDPASALIRSLRRPIAPAAATREDAMAEAGSGMRMASGAGRCEVSAEELVEGRGYADMMPALSDVRLSPTGELWVERFEPGARPDDRFGPIDIFGPEGEYVGTLPPGTPLPVAFLPDDRIIVSEKDAFDVERLVVLRIRRSSAETS